MRRPGKTPNAERIESVVPLGLGFFCPEPGIEMPGYFQMSLVGRK